MMVLLAGATVAVQLKATTGDPHRFLMTSAFGGEIYADKTRCAHCRGVGTVPYEGPEARRLFSGARITRVVCPKCGSTGRSA